MCASRYREPHLNSCTQQYKASIRLGLLTVVFATLAVGLNSQLNSSTCISFLGISVLSRCFAAHFTSMILNISCTATLVYSYITDRKRNAFVEKLNIH